MNNKTKIMGILNVTPDSFTDGGEYFNPEHAIDHALLMQDQGADIIDVGGESTRPDAVAVSVEEELARVLPVIKELKTKLKIPLSIDTMKPQVAKACIEAGVTLLNDITGFRDPEMIDVAAEFDVSICCMHMQGTPRDMQKNPHYDQGVIDHLMVWMDESVERLLQGGVDEKKIILDPGIGFGKTVDDNLQIIHNLPKLRSKGYPLLVGASRKSFMTRILDKPPLELGAATIAAHTLAVIGGADYIRVHDVMGHNDALTIISRVRECIKFGD